MSRAAVGLGKGTDVDAIAQEACARYQEIVDELDRMADELRPMVEGLTDPDERTAMRLRYLERYRVEAIANGMAYCERHTFRILKRAEEKVMRMAAEK